ncbi:MAG: GAF domain-containing protein [Candidatus Brocadia sp.]|nr:GAF domain-containing protein [Candidatus Brocadia sp.]
MTTSTLNTSVQEDMQTVQDTLHDIKCLSKLYHMLYHPCRADTLWNDSYDSCKELNLREVRHALISVLDMEKLFPLVNNLTVCGTGSLSGIVALVVRDEIQLKASIGLPNYNTNSTTFKVGDGVIGWVVKHGEAIVTNDIEKDERFNKQQCMWYGGKAILCVPIKVQGRVIGVISVNNKKLGETYNNDDMRFLETIAAYTSIAIRDSDLYKRLNKSSKLEQLTSAYHDNNKYLPVTLRSIKTGAFAECDLYLQTIVNREIKYLLYCKGNNLFDDERKQSFVKKNISKIYIAKNGNAQYLRYMEANLEQIAIDEMTAVHERIRIVYDVAVNLLADTLKGSNIFVNVERAKDWITVILDFMLRNKEVCSQFMKVLTYDGNVFSHSVNTAVIGLLFGHYLGISAGDLLVLGTGLLLHDIGKIRIDPYTVKKDFETLTKEEKELLRKHADLGFILLSNSGNLAKEACLIAKQHHEQYGGKGYPEGLKGDEIHYYSRITRILDEFEMRMSKTTPNNGSPAFQVLQFMVKGMNGNFDKEILKKFIDFMHVSDIKVSVKIQHNNVVEFVR